MALINWKTVSYDESDANRKIFTHKFFHSILECEMINECIRNRLMISEVEVNIKTKILNEE